MKSRIALSVLAVLLLGSVSEAGLFHHTKKSDEDQAKPEASSSGPGARAPHLSRYNRAEWGSEWKRIFREPRPYAVGHYNKID